jgi:hypothetical protein
MPTTRRYSMTWQNAAKRIATAKGFTSLEEILDHSEKPEVQNAQVEALQARQVLVSQQERVTLENSLHLTDRSTAASTVMLRTPVQPVPVLEPVPVAAATTVTEAVWQQAVQMLEEHRAELGTFYRLMLTLTAASIVVRGNRPKHAIIPMMIPATAIAEAAGFSESYLWRLLRDHEALARRWIAWDGWTTSWQCAASEKGKRNVKGGTIWIVRTKPLEPGLKVLMKKEDYEHEWRNLERDVKDGRTVRCLGEKAPRARGRRSISSVSNYPKEQGLYVLNAYLQSSLTRLSNPGSGVSHLDTELSGETRLYALWDVLTDSPKGGHDARAAWAVKVGQLASTALHDRQSLAWWTKCAWTVIRCEAHGQDFTARMVLHQALHDVLVGSSDNPLVRNRAALAIHSMMVNGWAEIAEKAAQNRVGRRTHKPERLAA